MEVEEMISKVKEKQGRPFDIKPLTTTCVLNVMMSMLFGRRFEHSDVALQQLLSNIQDGIAEYSFALDLFPALRIFPSFKKMIATILQTITKMNFFINKNIDDCSQVCHCTN